jgi:hypothetical protein
MKFIKTLDQINQRKPSKLPFTWCPPYEGAFGTAMEIGTIDIFWDTKDEFLSRWGFNSYYNKTLECRLWSLNIGKVQISNNPNGKWWKK